MRIIVGLGNPGRKYSATRHNAGFMVLDRLAKTHSVRFRKSILNSAYIAKVEKKRWQVLLVKPATFMNNSGICVKKIMVHYNIEIDDILIVYDDVDLELGTIRFRTKGRSAGHKGVNSIIQYLNTDLIQRIRIGIGKPDSEDISDYVLSDFTDTEKAVFDTVVQKASRCCWSWIDRDVGFIMQRCN